MASCRTTRWRSTRRGVRAGVLAACLSPLAASGQQNPPLLPRVPELPPQQASAVGAFVEGISRKDAAVEIRLGHGSILSLKEDLFAGAGKDGQPTIAVGDPGVLDFHTISSRQIRLVGLKLGSTDLAVTTADGRTFTFEVEVVPDLDRILGQLRRTFPDASLRLGYVGDHVVVEGQARDASQSAQIVRTLQSAVASASAGAVGRVDAPASTSAPAGPMIGGKAPPTQVAPPTSADLAAQTMIGGSSAPAESLKILNLIKVPGSHQVLLKVRVAELNRTALRQIGANTLAYDAKSGSIFGSQIGSPIAGNASIAPITQSISRSFSQGTGTSSISSSTPLPAQGLIGTATSALTSGSTLFGIFQNSNFDVFLNALRENAMLRVLAEPNLLAMSGQKATFLAGGEFPVPVPQSSANGAVPAITVTFKAFGVTLDFLPVVHDDGVIQLTVDPEVSQIDPTVATTLVAGGSPVPGVTTRKAHTTVELKEGQTLAIAGLLQLTLDGRTRRIPGLGDLPVLGPFFSNTTSNRVEKELIVLVTPYLVEPLNPGQVPPAPGDEVGAPNDLEFYLLNRIEGRTGRDHRATTDGADPLRIGRLIHLERKHVRGPVGYSD